MTDTEIVAKIREAVRVHDMALHNFTGGLNAFVEIRRDAYATFWTTLREILAQGQPQGPPARGKLHAGVLVDIEG